MRMSASRFYHRVLNGPDVIQVEAGDRYTVNPDGSGTFFGKDGSFFDFAAGDLLQCTGVTDRNGETLYEGDVVSDGNADLEIFWSAGGFYMRPVGSGAEWNSFLEVAAAQAFVKVGRTR